MYIKILILLIVSTFSSSVNSKVDKPDLKKLKNSCKKSLFSTYVLLHLHENINNCLSSRKNHYKDLLKSEKLHLSGKLDKAVQILSPYENSKNNLPLLRYKLGELYFFQGNSDKANGLFDRILDDYDRNFIGNDKWSLTAAGKAAIKKRKWEIAEDIFVKLYKKYPDFVPGLIAGGKYDRIIEFYDRSIKYLKRAVKISPFYPLALSTFAKTLFKNPYSKTNGLPIKYAEKALKLNKQHLPSLHILGLISLYNLDFKATMEKIKKADQIYMDHPSTLTLKAGIAQLKDKKSQISKIEKLVKKKYPLHWNHFYQLGRLLNRHHRYPLSAVYFKKGLEISPDNASLLTWLGVSLLRTGKEGLAIYYIRKAAELNYDHVMANNLLTLYETKIFKKYSSNRMGNFLYKAPKKEWPILKLLVPPVLDKAFNRYKKHYGYTPPLPVKIEFFKDKQDFTVLIAGQPVETGILGVCFGTVIDFLSPSSGRSNWAMVISHELAHTFHVEQTKGKIPRWFTEGLAEFETAHYKYTWKRERSRGIYLALEENSLHGIKTINDAFSHARSTLAMVTAYIHATWIIRYIFLNWGWEGLRKGLNAYQNGKNTVEAIKLITGLQPEQFDKRFFNYLKLTLSHYSKGFSPLSVKYVSLEKLKKQTVDPARHKSRLALKYLLANKNSLAENLMQTAKKIDPRNPHLLFAIALKNLKDGNLKKAEKTLNQLLISGHDGFSIRRFLAVITQRKNNKLDTIKHLQKALKYDPESLPVLKKLAFLYYSGSNPAAALPFLKKYSRYSQNDGSSAMKTVELAWKSENHANTAEFGLHLMEINPFIAGKAHLHTAKSLFKINKKALALKPLLVYLKTQNKPDKNGKVRLMLAQALIALDRQKEAAVILRNLSDTYPGLLEVQVLLHKMKEKNKLESSGKYKD
ncbi:MAG: tetratricopeptide repeat protein [Deltaproteobacteria bacterium]|jgi:tetratricopeptide (TPR) repeat protein|nr:tetratricopeptide repeat protein [Deltaproteobacteria bacterium]